MKMSTLARRLAALCLFAFSWLPGALLAQTTGTIKGVVTDESGAPLPGVTVTVTSPQLQGEATEFTDESGGYRITELPPGEYLVRYYFANVVAERPRVELRAEQTLQLNIELKTKEVKGETYTIEERAPTVDIGSTQVITTITNEVAKNVPLRGRTYEAALSVAPGATSDDVGASFGGATGSENLYILDGLNTTDPAYGLLGTVLTMEFLEETNIIQAGYRAEYGRATGGVVSLVTKSGTDQVKGSIFGYLQPLQLEPRRVARLGEAIASVREFNARGMDFGFEVGGPIIKDRLHFFVGVNPSYQLDRYTRFIRTRLADAIPAGTTGVYEGDREPGAACPAWVRDADSAGDSSALCVGPGTSEGVAGLGPFATRDIPGAERRFSSEARRVNYIGKLDLRISEDAKASLSYIGSPSRFHGLVDNPNNPNSPTSPGGFNSDPAILGFSNNLDVHDVILNTDAKFLERKLEVSFRAGYHTASDHTIPSAQGGGFAQDVRTVPLTTFERVPECEVVVRDGVTFNPCPVTSYGYQGFGFQQTLDAQRLTLGLDLTYFLEALGTHAFKLGGDVENNRYKNARSYTGGESGGEFRIDRSDEGILGVRRTQFGTTDLETGKPIITPGGFSADSRTLNEAFFLRDSYSTSLLPGLTVDLGVRWELQQLKDINGKTAISINDNISPRVGLIYDFTRKGKSKLYASYGRFYESIPLDINDRAFSREAFIIQNLQEGASGFCPTDTQGRVNTSRCRFPNPSADPDAVTLGGEAALIQPGLKGQYSNLLNVGAEYDVGFDVVLGAAYIHKDLGRIIEDVSPDGGLTYVIANPGSDVDPKLFAETQDRVRDLDKQVAETSDQAERAKLEKALSNEKAILANYRDIASFPKAKRTYDALQLTARKHFSDNLMVIASYTYSRTIGNYPGTYQASNGQLDPNISTQYDLKDLLVNRDGPLPNDRPHNVKLLGWYFIPVGLHEGDGVSLSAELQGSSGVPIDVLGAHPIYGAVESFILPRGSGGRTPWITRLNVGLKYKTTAIEGYGIEAGLDVFNVLNQRGVTAVNEEYTTDYVSPIANGTVADLANLRNTSGALATRNVSYGQPVGYQAPLALRLGARVEF